LEYEKKPSGYRMVRGIGVVLHRALAFALTFSAAFGLISQSAEARPERHAAMIVDANTGAVLHNDDGDKIRHPASLTKMMTLYLTFETIESGRLKMSDKIPISEAAAGVAPSKLDLDSGDEIAVSDAILALITKSANDIAVALAEKIGGTEANFVRLMNARARDMGMSKTHFENPNGLPNDDHVSTAHDMITLALHLQDDYPTYYRLFATHAFKYRGKTYRNHNTMLNTFAGIDGIKTGYTRASGFNIVTSVRRGNRHLVGAVFGSSSAAKRNAEMRVLLTRALTRASTKNTRKPQPLLLAKLKAAPKAAAHEAPKRQAKVELADATASGPRPFAPAKAQDNELAVPNPGPVLRAMAKSQPAAPGQVAEPPVKIFKVRHVPILEKARAAPPSPDETTDMEGIDSPSDETPPESGGTTERTDLVRTAAKGGDGATAFAGRLSQSFAESRARDEALEAQMARDERRPSPLDDKIAMLGAADTAPPAAMAPSPSVSPTPAAATQEPSTTPQSVAAPLRGLPPSTLATQASALKATTKPRVAKSQPGQAVSLRATAGRYEVQIGAFGSVSEAQRALTAVQGRVGQLLAGMAPVTQPTTKDGHQIFRARFAGFNADRAASTCTELRRQSVDCFVMAAGD
jgi:D-alanyl-D-alanine carboxypeptidase